MDFVGFFSMVIQVVLLYTQCLRYNICSAWFLILEYQLVYIVIVTQFATTQHNDAFLEIQSFASASFIYLKLCSIAIPMLYCKYFWVTRLASKRSNTLALYAFLRQLTLHVLNYLTIAHRYSNIQSWDHSTQYECSNIHRYSRIF